MSFGIFFYSQPKDYVRLYLYGDAGTYHIDSGDGFSFDHHHPKRGADYIDLTYGKDGDYLLKITEERSQVPSLEVHTQLHYFDPSDQQVTGHRGVDMVETGSGDDLIRLRAGDDAGYGFNGEDRLYGGLGDDQLSGGGGTDILRGGGGEDDLDGGMGNDVLHGGKDEDFLSDSGGHDVLRGGAGGDIFAFEVLQDIAANGHDRIADFSGVNGEHDVIEIGGFDQFFFIGSQQFDGKEPELREIQGVNPRNHIIQGDSNGDGKVDFSFVVHGDKVTIGDLIGVRSPSQAPLAVSHHIFIGHLELTNHLPLA